MTAGLSKAWRLLTVCSIAAYFTIAATSSFADTDPLDASTERLASCDVDQIRLAKIEMFSWSDTVPLCKVAYSVLGKYPQIGAFRHAALVAYLIKKDNEATPRDTFYQLFNIVEIRKLSNDLNRTKKTFDIVYKVNTATAGHVSPRDLNVYLQNSGEMAHTLSDNGLISMASVLWEMKKRNGD